MPHRVGCGFNINGSRNIVIRSSCSRNKDCKGVSQHYHLCRCASSLMVLCTPQHVVVKLSNIRYVAPEIDCLIFQKTKVVSCLCKMAVCLI
ncbi:hypothetical protein XENORESO_018490 [Xenotaenia resolanae]|uniref:Uncharacterized protein n=1 Tax=Xenotaenia resolanae TaxID=208358 RepID=A0ABV0WMN2_9TELE